MLSSYTQHIGDNVIIRSSVERPGLHVYNVVTHPKHFHILHILFQVRSSWDSSSVKPNKSTIEFCWKHQITFSMLVPASFFIHARFCPNTNLFISSSQIGLETLPSLLSPLPNPMGVKLWFLCMIKCCSSVLRTLERIIALPAQSLSPLRVIYSLQLNRRLIGRSLKRGLWNNRAPRSVECLLFLWSL